MLSEPPEILAEFYQADKEGKLDSYKNDNNKKQEYVSFASKPAPLKALPGQRQHPSKIFENTIMVLIIMSSVLLAVDNPLYDPESKLVIIIGNLDIICTCLFTVEATIKMIAKGCIYNNMGPIKPYMKSYWNMLDSFVVSAALFDLIFMIAKIDV